MQIDRPIAIAVILFVIMLTLFFLVVPEYNTFGKLQTELGKKKAEFNAEFEYYAEIAKVHNDLQAHKDDIKKVDDALPEESSLGKLVYFFQQTAKDNGMLIKNIFLSKPPLSNVKTDAKNTVKDIVFLMDLVGDYTSLGKFMASLEKSSRIFEITNISFGSASAPLQESSQSQFQIQQTYVFNLQVKTHSY